MSVHLDRGAWVVRWRQDGQHRARRFHTEPEARAFDEGISGGARPRSSTPNVYPYETAAGLRWRYTYRDSRGRSSTKRGFASERAAARDREQTVARVRGRGLYVSRVTFAEFLPDWLSTRKPYLATGTWSDYEIHGRKRLVPHFGELRLTAITTFEVRDCEQCARRHGRGAEWGRRGSSAAAQPGGRRRVYSRCRLGRKRERGRWTSKGQLAPMDRNTVSSSWHKQALDDAGLRDMPLHALRHTAAAAWLLTSHPLIYVQRQLGHASIKTTESFYGHLEESFLQSAPAVTEAAIRDASRQAVPG